VCADEEAELQQSAPELATSAPAESLRPKRINVWQDTFSPQMNSNMRCAAAARHAFATLPPAYRLSACAHAGRLQTMLSQGESVARMLWCSSITLAVSLLRMWACSHPGSSFYDAPSKGSPAKSVWEQILKADAVKHAAFDEFDVNSALHALAASTTSACAHADRRCAGALSAALAAARTCACPLRTCLVRDGQCNSCPPMAAMEPAVVRLTSPKWPLDKLCVAVQTTASSMRATCAPSLARPPTLRRSSSRRARTATARSAAASSVRC
jgi:hypothetical protein